MHDKQARRISTATRYGMLAELRVGPFALTTLPRHLHEELQVILSEKRLITYDLKGKQVVSPLRSVFVVEPETPHSARVERDQTEWGALRTFLIPRSCFSHYLGENAIPAGLSFASPILSSAELLKSFSKLHDMMIGAHDSLLGESTAALSLEHLLSFANRPPTAVRCRRPDWKMRMVRELLGDDLSSRLSLSEIADSVDRSPFHILRQFQAYFGMTPHAFRTQLRVSRARDLLVSGMSISEVAQLTGFSDHAHLTRTFHRFLGVPPSRYETAISFKT